MYKYIKTYFDNGKLSVTTLDVPFYRFDDANLYARMLGWEFVRGCSMFGGWYRDNDGSCFELHLFN
jgi:hypothetical protein